jgi:hypothetical protein
VSQPGIEVQGIPACQSHELAIREVHLDFAAQHIDELLAGVAGKDLRAVIAARGRWPPSGSLFAGRLGTEKLIGDRLARIDHALIGARDDGTLERRRGFPAPANISPMSICNALPMAAKLS